MSHGSLCSLLHTLSRFFCHFANGFVLNQKVNWSIVILSQLSVWDQPLGASQAGMRGEISMIRKLLSPKAACVRIIFELPACIWADRIFLVGDFNDWNSSVAPFAQNRDGVWRAMLDLPAGREYQFRYLVDGRWQTDLHADGWADNEFGSQNSIVDATLPPESSPLLGETSLLHEGSRWSALTQSHTATVRPSHLPATNTASRYFPPRSKAAG